MGDHAVVNLAFTIIGALNHLIDTEFDLDSDFCIVDHLSSGGRKLGSSNKVEVAEVPHRNTLNSSLRSYK
jgi:hypothetical protein